MRRDVARNRNMIMRAYLDLMFKNAGERITVQDVISKADVSRGTFYAHFRDISDLNEQTENFIVSFCREILTQKPLEEMMTHPESAVSVCIDIFTRYQEEIRTMSQNGKNPAIIYKLTDLIRESIAESIHQTFPAGQAAVLSSCIAGAVVDGCISWVLSGKPVNEKALASDISLFLSDGISGFRKGNV